MPKYGSDDIRNVAFAGPPNAGKTTLLEAMLHQAKTLARRGNVADGTSLVDYDALEREKKHTLFLKLFHATHQKRELNLLDSPGYPDYVGEALAAMNAVETVALCISALDGVTFHARRLWNDAIAAGRGRVILVNRVDVDNLDLDALIGAIQEMLGPQCLPLNVPIDPGPGVSGVVDLLGAFDQAPASVKERVAAWREQLVDGLVSLDDALMERYLESGEVAAEDLARLVPQGIASGAFTPILFTAAVRDVGVTETLDFLAERAPSPLRGPGFQGCTGSELTDDVHAIDPNEHTEFVGRVFKTLADPYVGRLSFVRALAGEIKTDELYLNARVGKPEKMGHILRPQGKEQEKVEHAVTGDIFVLGKAETIETNDTLSTEKAPMLLPPIRVPTPMVALAVVPKNHGDDQKLATGLRRICGEDLTFSMDRDPQTGELIVHGVSPLHVETQLHRLATNYKVEVDTKIPRVPMRETVAAKADGHFRHKKQTGGRGQFAEVFLRVAPRERGSGFEFKDETYGGSIPRNFLPAIEKGVIDQMEKGVAAGYHVVDVEVAVYDGKHHDVDSDEHSFKRAGARAFRDAFEKAHPVLLEPVVDLEVAVPSRFMGDINSDLNGRRGRISGMEALGDIQIIRAQVPLKEVQTYAADLRSITQGEGSYSFQFSHYDVVPHKVAEDLMAHFKAGLKEEE